MRDGYLSVPIFLGGIFDVVNIIVLLVLLALAIIPAVIANKKYYSAIGFYIYGVLGFLPALIHVICLPDRARGDQRKASAGAIVWGALAGIIIMYKVVIDFVEMLDDFGIFGFKGIGIFWILASLMDVALGIWLLVCIFRCDRSRGIMMNFIISAVLAFIAPIISLVGYSIQMAHSEKLTVGFGQIFMRELTLSGSAFVEGTVLCATFLVFALFVYRLNAGQSVMPKALYCLVPGIVVAIMSIVLVVANFRYTTITPIAGNTLNIFKVLLIVAYLWAVSNIPSSSYVSDGIDMGVAQ